MQLCAKALDLDEQRWDSTAETRIETCLRIVIPKKRETERERERVREKDVYIICIYIYRHTICSLLQFAKIYADELLNFSILSGGL